MLSLPLQITFTLFISIYILVHYVAIMKLKYMNTVLSRFALFFLITYGLLYILQFGLKLSNTTTLLCMLSIVVLPYVFIALKKLLLILNHLNMDTVKGRVHFLFFLIGFCIFLTLLQMF